MTSQPATRSLTLPAAGTYRLDTQRSTITYTSRHMFGTGTVRAEFSIASGQLTVGQSLAQCKASAVIEAASFRSDNPKRDRDVKGKGLLDVARFPQIAFESRGLLEDGGEAVLTGTVAMHGVAAPVEVHLHSWQEPISGDIRVLARAEHLDRLTFGITGARGWVGRYFDLAFDVVAARIGPLGGIDAPNYP